MMTNKTLINRITLMLVLALVCSTAWAKTKTATSGTTSVTLSNDFLNAIASLGITAGTVAPTTLVGAKATFPVVAGAIDLQNAKGEVIHSGGLTLTKGSTVVRLQSFTIDTTGSTLVLSGIATVNDAVVGRLTLFDLTLPNGFKLPIQLTSGVFLDLKNVGVTLDSGAAATLNSVFGTTGFTAGLNIGTARVQALFQCE